MNTLTEVRKYLSNVSMIHNGGCAISAIAMKRWLAKNKKDTEDIKFIYDYSIFSQRSFNQNERFLKGKEDYPSSCSHAYLLYRDKIIDCHSNYLKYELREDYHVLDEDFVLKSINSFNNWNDSFNRRLVPLIAKDLDIDLSDIKLKREEKS